jgi:peptidoglycan/LPS O-acetylase OafA/YrhL
MLYHGLVPWVPGGFLGVDIFFVLSGFLITSLLLVEWKRWRRVDLVTFWIHRARRLLPALLVMVVVTSVLAWRLEPAEKLTTIRGDALATLLYVANWRFILKDQSYFEQYGDPSPFRHMWSLGIEEQYYLLFPLLLIGLLTLIVRRARWLWLFFALGAVGSALLMAALFDPIGDPSRIYYGTDTRAQELLVGAAAAALVQLPPGRLRDLQAPRWLLEGAGALSLVALLAALTTAHDTDPWLYRGGFLLISVAAATLITTVTRPQPTVVARLLGVRPLVGIGLISYGLYLWHWPVDIFISPYRTGLDGPPLLLIRCVVALACALASYWLVERPIRRGALRRFGPIGGRTVAWLSVPLTAVVVLASTATAVAPPTTRWQLPPMDPGSELAHVNIVGDSVAATVAAGVPRDLQATYRFTDQSVLGCGLGPKHLFVAGREGPPVEECDHTTEAIAERSTRDPAQATLLFYGAWETADHLVAGKRLRVGSPEYAAYLGEQLTDVIRAVAPNDQPVLLANVPCYHDNATTGALASIADVRNSEKRQAAVNSVFGAVAAAHRNVSILDLRSFVCSGADGGVNQSVRYDGVHFTSDGAAQLWAWLKPQLAEKVGAASPPPADPQEGGVRTMLLGDSVPYGLLADFPRDGSATLIPLDGTKLGCGLLPEATFIDGRVSSDQPEQCAQHSRELPQRIESAAPQVGVVFVGIGEQFDRLVGGSVLEFGTDAYREWLTEQLAAKTALFTTRDLPALIVNVPCHRVVDLGIAPQPPVINDDERISWVNSVVSDFVADHPEVQLVDLHGKLCADGYQEVVEGTDLRYDGMHFTPEGAAYVWEWLAPQITETVSN